MKRILFAALVFSAMAGCAAAPSRPNAQLAATNGTEDSGVISLYGQAGYFNNLAAISNFEAQVAPPPQVPAGTSRSTLSLDSGVPCIGFAQPLPPGSTCP